VDARLQGRQGRFQSLIRGGVLARRGGGECQSLFERGHLERGITMERLDRITINPEVCLGQPTIRGMRITISVILKMLAGGYTTADVLEAYPELEAEDIQQAVQYAAWVVSDQIQMVPA